MKRILEVIFILAFVLTSSNVLADETFIQEDLNRKYSLGVYGNYGLNFHSGLFSQLPGIPDCCPEYRNGFGTGIGSGLILDFPINIEKSSIGIRLGFVQLGGDFITKAKIGDVLLYDANGNPVANSVEAFSEHNLNAFINTIVLGGDYNYKLWKDLIVSAGINFAYAIENNANVFEKLVEPRGYYFENQKLIRNENYGKEIEEFMTFQTFVKFGAGYSLKAGENFRIVPEMEFWLPLFDFIDAGWSVNRLSFGVALMYDVYPKKQIPELRDTIIKRDTTTLALKDIKDVVIEFIGKKEKTEVENTNNAIIYTTIINESYSRKIPLAVEVIAKIEGDFLEKNEIMIEEFETEESFPLLPQIFFSKAESSLEGDKYIIIDTDIAEVFDESKIGRNSLVVYGQVLNIIGNRLKNNPKANLTLTGCNSGEQGENISLSKARADEVKAYIVDTWGINPNRLNVKTQNIPSNPGRVGTPEGNDENRRVELTSSDLNIIKPVSLKEVIRKSNPPVANLHPMISYPEGSENVEYNLEISQSGNVLRKYSGKGPGEPVKWYITDEPSPKLETPIEIELIAKDNYGNVGRDFAKTEVKQLTIKKKRFEHKDDMRIEKFALIVFDYDQSRLTPLHKDIIDEIKKRIEPNSKVKIEGYTDKTGEAEYNKQLAARRVQEVQKALNVSNVETEAVGSSRLLFDNATPQGRSYCRTVLITIETPIKE